MPPPSSYQKLILIIHGSGCSVSIINIFSIGPMRRSANGSSIPDWNIRSSNLSSHLFMSLGKSKMNSRSRALWWLRPPSQDNKQQHTRFLSFQGNMQSRFVRKYRCPFYEYSLLPTIKLLLSDAAPNFFATSAKVSWQFFAPAAATSSRRRTFPDQRHNICPDHLGDSGLA